MLCRTVIGLRPACARPAQSGRALSSWLGPALLPQARPNGRAQASRALSSWLAGSAGDASGITMHGTTILCVRKEGKVAMIGDGQVSLGNIVMKPNAKKVRRIGDDIIVGFAGSTADAFTLLERLERKLEEHPGQLTRACVDLAKAWRTDKYLRRLEVRVCARAKNRRTSHRLMDRVRSRYARDQAVLLVADKKVSFELTGNGDVLEPKDGIMGTFLLVHYICDQRSYRFVLSSPRHWLGWRLCSRSGSGFSRRARYGCRNCGKKGHGRRERPLCIHKQRIYHRDARRRGGAAGGGRHEAIFGVMMSQYRIARS